MPHTVELLEIHASHVLEALLIALDWRLEKYANQSSRREETQRQYWDACRKLVGPVRCGTTQKNLFTWIIDQLEHTSPYIDTELFQTAIIHCRAAAKNIYGNYCDNPQLSPLKNWGELLSI